MKIKISFVFIVALLALSGVFLAAGAQVQTQDSQELSKVLVIDIEEEIRAGTTQFIKRSLQKAEKEGFNLVVIQINTPGGLLKATEEISRLLLDSKIKIAVFVHKSGGWAFSAGTFILLSAEIAVSHPNALIGASQPRVLGIGEAAEPDEKIIEASSGWIKSLAEARGRNPEVAEKFVRENLTLSGQEAYEQNIINFTASSLDELLGNLELKNAVIEEVKPNLLEQILSFLSISFLIPLLLGIGSLGLFFVFRTGEVEIGIFAVIALLLGLWGMGAINLSVLGTTLLFFGIALIILEIFVMPEFGVFGIAGTAAFLFGILTFAQEPFLPNVFSGAAFWFAMGAALAISVFFIVLSRLSLKTLKMKAKVGPEALVEETAIVTEALNPYGKVKINREDWTAKNISDKEIIKAGEEVQIVKVQGNVIMVKAKRSKINKL
ncbi:nodulation protein NfeD [Patescibacteria group bacterium AH-259-L07]|nr:nodulation protein NfeD [Patescibacteria group bacterium AH-259-L07]